MNRRDGTFEDMAWLAGAAVNRDGRPEGSMGVDAGDFDADGDGDLFMTHIATETNTLYVNDGLGLFEDRTVRVGLGPPSLPFTGFGTGWFDFDNDGWLDLVVANGEIRTMEALARVNDPFPLHQRNQLFRNLGQPPLRRGERRGRRGLRALRGQPRHGVRRHRQRRRRRRAADQQQRAGAPADQRGRRRRQPLGRPAARRRLGPGHAGGPGRGVPRCMGPALWRRARTDGSYVSASDPRVLVGLGPAAALDRVRVVWPDGGVEEWADVAVDGWTTLVRGTGRRVE